MRWHALIEMAFWYERTFRRFIVLFPHFIVGRIDQRINSSIHQSAQAVDLYSFGVILWQLWFQIRNPWGAKPLHSIMRLVAKGKRPSDSIEKNELWPWAKQKQRAASGMLSLKKMYLVKWIFTQVLRIPLGQIMDCPKNPKEEEPSKTNNTEDTSDTMMNLTFFKLIN